MRIAVAAVSILTLACSAGGVQAAFPGGNGRLVFTQWTAPTDRYGTPRAYLCSAASDGSAQTRLTDTPARDGHPSFSPDGSRLAFVRGGSTTIGTLVVSAANGSDERVFTSAVQLSSPSWRADGKSVVASRLGELVEITVADGAERRLVQTPAVAELDPEPSPDGTRLAYVTSPMTAPEPRTLVVAAADGSAPRSSRSFRAFMTRAGRRMRRDAGSGRRHRDLGRRVGRQRLATVDDAGATLSPSSPRTGRASPSFATATSGRCALPTAATSFA